MYAEPPHPHQGFGFENPPNMPHQSSHFQHPSHLHVPSGAVGTMPLDGGIDIRTQSTASYRRLSTNPLFPRGPYSAAGSMGVPMGNGGTSWKNSLSASVTNGLKNSVSGQHFLDYLSHSLTSGSFKDMNRFESEFCRDFRCCGLQLQDLHELVTHWEEKHNMDPGAEGGLTIESILAMNEDYEMGEADGDDGYVGLEGPGGDGMIVDAEDAVFFGGGEMVEVREEVRNSQSPQQTPSPEADPNAAFYMPTTHSQVHSRFMSSPGTPDRPPSAAMRSQPTSAIRAGSGFLAHHTFFGADTDHMDMNVGSLNDAGIAVQIGQGAQAEIDVIDAQNPAAVQPVPDSPPIGVAPGLVQGVQSLEAGGPFDHSVTPRMGGLDIIKDDASARPATPPLQLDELYGGARRSARNIAREPKIVVDDDGEGEEAYGEEPDEQFKPHRTESVARRQTASASKPPQSAVRTRPQAQHAPVEEFELEEDDEDYDEEEEEMADDDVDVETDPGDGNTVRANRIIKRPLNTAEDEEYIMEGRGIVKGVKGDRKYICAHIGCDKIYKNPGGLKYHLAHGHPDPTKSTIPAGLLGRNGKRGRNVPDIYKPYRCCIETCGKRYKNLNGLKYHLEHHHPDEIPITTDKEGRPKWDLSSCYDPLVLPPPGPVPLPAPDSPARSSSPAISASHRTGSAASNTPRSGAVRAAGSHGPKVSGTNAPRTGSAMAKPPINATQPQMPAGGQGAKQPQSQQHTAAQLQKAAQQLFAHFQQQFQSNPEAAAALLQQQSHLLTQLTPSSGKGATDPGVANLQQLFADAQSVIAEAHHQRSGDQMDSGVDFADLGTDTSQHTAI